MKVSGSGGLHVINQVNLDDLKKLFEEVYVDTVHVVQVDPYLYFLFQTHLKNTLPAGKNKTKNKKKNTDADTMYGNNSLPGTQQTCVSHCELLIN